MVICFVTGNLQSISLREQGSSAGAKMIKTYMDLPITLAIAFSSSINLVKSEGVRD